MIDAINGTGSVRPNAVSLQTHGSKPDGPAGTPPRRRVNSGRSGVTGSDYAPMSIVRIRVLTLAHPAASSRQRSQEVRSWGGSPSQRRLRISIE